MDTKREYDSSKFERPSVTVDVLFFTVIDEKLQVLLVKRAAWPYKGMWALPGGFVGMKETLDDAAEREIFEECGVKDLFLEQLYTFGDPKRDPRTRVITVTYYALAPSSEIKRLQKDEVSEAKYFSVDQLPKLAFDHRKIIDFGLQRLKNKLGYSNIVFGLLPDSFSLSEVQKVYEIVLGKSIDKRNFRKRMLSTGMLEPTGDKMTGKANRPAALYRFSKRDLVII